MTVSTTLNKIIFPGNASATVFPFTFAVPAGSLTQQLAEVQVFYTSPTGVVTLLATNAYTLAVNPATGIDPTPAGGSVTYNPGSPIPLGSFLTILRTLPLTQATSLANQTTPYQVVTEGALDYEMMVSQQVLEVQSRALVVNVSDPTPNPLPAVASRAGLFLAFDSMGNPIAAAPSGASTPVSSAMAPVVAAASLAAGRTAFGLGAMATEGIGAGLQDDGAGNARVVFGLVSDAVSQSVVAGFDLTRRQALAAITYTFPLTSTLFSGFGHWIQTNGFAVTLAINGADKFSGAPTGQGLTLQPGQTVFIQTDGAGTWFVDYGPQLGFNQPLNLQLSAIVGGNNLTISIKDRSGNDPTPSSPVIFTVSAGGNSVPRAITGPLSITVPSGATLGTVNGQANRIWVGLFDNAGSPVLAVYNSLNSTGPTLLAWDESTQTSATAISAGSTLSQTWYGASGITTKAFRIIGYVESTQAAAGTWTSALSKTQLFGPGIRKPGETVQEASTLYASATVTSTTFALFTAPESIALTPISAANLQRVEATGSLTLGGSTTAFLKLSRGSGANTNMIGTLSTAVGSITNQFSFHCRILDIPNTSSPLTYNLQGSTGNGTQLTVNSVEVSAKEIQI